MDKKVQTRVVWIDMYKAILTLLVIIGHFVLKWVPTSEGGNIYSICNTIAAVIYSFHMPAFIMISGYSYKRYLYQKAQDTKVFIKNKAMELLIPYMIFSLIFGGMKVLGEAYTLSPSGGFDLLVFPIKPIGYLWFIYTLFIMYSIASVLQKWRVNKVLLVLVTIVMHVCFYFVDIPWFDINRLLRYSIFFVLGIFIYNYESDFEKRLTNWVVVLSAIIFLVVEFVYISLLGQRIEFSTQFYNSTEYPVLYFICALLGTLLLFVLCKKSLNQKKLNNTYICMLGKYSLVYYLLHQMTISILRAIGIKLNMISFWYQIIVVFGGTLVICTFAVFLIKRYNFIAGFFYPKKWIVKK